MTGRDNVLWLQCWRDRRTDFHQHAVNPLLAKFWPKLALAQGSRVFVPLCGKSLDMIWLAGQGYAVVGVELSPIAVRAFFSENKLKPVRRQRGQFTLWQHANISILCGDYFALTQADLGRIDTVYDRAALTALPEDLRKQYVGQLGRIVPETAQVLLLTTEDAEAGDTLEQTLGIAEEITALYAEAYEIELAHVESVFGADPESPERTEYKVYRLSAKPDSGWGRGSQPIHR
ncbi:MAG: thiopurine S-methyltransferase [Methylovulum sp.]|nr:thiopurine S-methyltransferase [Methylovulum sp.]